MESHYSYCGFDCKDCPLYIASHTEDKALKEKIVKKYKLEKNSFCLGCLSNSPSPMCSKCSIKACCEEKKVKNCGHCASLYSCKKISVILRTNIKSAEFLESENQKYKEGK